MWLRGRECGARAYVEGLEDIMVATAARFGVQARGRVPGAPGVWVQSRKLGAVGVRISSGVASHGIALNVSTNLRWFEHIVPCGIVDKARGGMRCRTALRAPVMFSRMVPDARIYSRRR